MTGPCGRALSGRGHAPGRPLASRGSSGGAGAWQAGTARGQPTSTLTAVHPYVLWTGQATSVWTMLGVGYGTAALRKAVAGRADLVLADDMVPVEDGAGRLPGERQWQCVRPAVPRAWDATAVRDHASLTAEQHEITTKPQAWRHLTVQNREPHGIWQSDD